MSEITAESVRESIVALTGPLREQLDEVDKACTVKQSELNTLRELQRELRSALRAVDPNYVHPNTKSNKNGGGKKNEIAAERVNQILAQIRQAQDRLPDDGFTATTLERMFPGTSVSTFGKALHVLHDRGDIRLDHRGRGGANYWKLVG